jgi:PAS domain S-box-containing protein
MKVPTRIRSFFISTTPLWVLGIDVVLEASLGPTELLLSIHPYLVGASALLLGAILWRELEGRRVAEESLRASHVNLEALVRQRSEEHARVVQHESSVLEATMENTETLLAYLDPQMNFVRANSAYVRGSGHTREELIGANHFALFPNAENERIFSGVRDSGQPVSFKAKPFEYADQPWRGVTYWDWTLVPVKDAGGTVTGLVISLREVTQEHIAETRRELHLSRLNALIAVTERTLKEQKVESLFQRIADAAREVTDARVSVAGHGYREGRLLVRASSRAEDVPPCPKASGTRTHVGGVYHAVMEADHSLRLTQEELLAHPRWRGLPEDHFPLRGLLGVRMSPTSGSDGGLVMVSDKRVGDFTEEDEALLSQLAALASLSLRHINARADAEKYGAFADAIFGAIANCVMVFDPGGKIIRANAAAVRLMGFDPTGSSLDAVVARLAICGAEGLPVALPALPSSRALQGETVLDVRLTVHSIDGGERIIRSSSAPIRLAEERNGAVTVWTDETERERLTQQLEVERANLKAIIENAPEGIVVVDDQARILLSNAAAEKHGLIHKFEAGPVEGATVSGAFREDGEPYTLEEMPLVRSARQGKVYRDVELEIRSADGAHRHLLMNSAPIRDLSGRISEAVGMVQDITLRKHTEEVSRQHELEYQLLMEQASDGIIIVDTHGRLHAANSRACELAGYGREEILAIDSSSLLFPEELASLAETVLREPADRGVIAEHRLRRRDGSVLFVETSIRKMSDGRYQAIVRDVTERKIREKEFSRAVKTHVFDRLLAMLREFQHGEVLAVNLHRLGLFARNLKALSGGGAEADGHARTRLETAVQEYRTITYQKLRSIGSLLTTVEGEMAHPQGTHGGCVSGTEILSLADSLLADAGELVQAIHSQPEATPQQSLPVWGRQVAEHAESLLRRINGATRQIEGEFTCEVSEVTTSVVGGYRAKNPGTLFEVIEESRGLKALIRSGELAEVLALIVSNALDALGGVGSNSAGDLKKVTARVFERAERVCIAIEDTGAGIPAEVRDRIFERGFSTKGEGHGNGLVYALDHLSPYGASLTLTDSPGGGSRFLISLVRV